MKTFVIEPISNGVSAPGRTSRAVVPRTPESRDDLPREHPNRQPDVTAIEGGLAKRADEFLEVDRR